MSAPKVVLIVLILIAVLFAIGVGVGIGRNDAGADAEKDWRATALSQLIPQKPLPMGDVHAGERFRNGVFTLLPGVPCVIEIAPSKTSLRTTTLKLTQSGPVEVAYQRNGTEGINVKMTLKPGEPRECKLQIFKSGGKLTLTSKAPPMTPSQVTMGE